LHILTKSGEAHLMETSDHNGESYENKAFSGKEPANGYFEDCSFKNGDFSNAVLASTKFVDCTFSNCNLTMAKLNHCLLNNAVFRSCKLLGVNFSDCEDLPFVVHFDSCVLDYCSFAGKKMSRATFSNSSMKNVDFAGSDLTKAVFSNTDLTNAVFRRTVLKEADFVTAANYSIDPEVNTMRKAKFSLQGVPGLLTKYDITIE
jgi:fluoroquinolone resistance protein